MQTFLGSVCAKTIIGLILKMILIMLSDAFIFAICLDAISVLHGSDCSVWTHVPFLFTYMYIRCEVCMRSLGFKWKRYSCDNSWKLKFITYHHGGLLTDLLLTWPVPLVSLQIHLSNMCFIINTTLIALYYITPLSILL